MRRQAGGTHKKREAFRSTKENMDILLFSIFDKKIGTFGQPIAVENVVTALRSISSAAKQGKGTMFENPHDFALYQVGAFDTEKGALYGEQPPKFIEEISNLMPKEMNQ